MPFPALWRAWLRVVPCVESLGWQAGVLLCAILFLCGCGSSNMTPVPTVLPAAPTITTQPSSQSTPLGQTATFTVVASGTAPLQYAWSENGSVINGAVSSSYTTPVVVATDSGSSFTVIVSNSEGSVSSNPALLSVGPRTPQAGDWRFQGMDLPAGTPVVATDIVSFQTRSFSNALGSPFDMGLIPGFNCGSSGPLDCGWTFFVIAAPTGSTWPTTVYRSDGLSNLDADLNAMATPNIVIASLDLEPANEMFAVSSLQTSAPDGFEYASQTVPLDQIQTVATQAGAQGRVITALGFDASGNALIVSYGWQNDTTTVYEASVIATTSTDSEALAPQFTDLAGQGYIITAMGGNAQNGLVIIGTRVQGDTLPRPIVVSTESGNQGQASNALQAINRVVYGTGASYFVAFSEQ